MTSGTLLYLHRVLAAEEHRPALGPDAQGGITLEELDRILAMPALADWDQVTNGGGIGLTFDDGFQDFVDIVLPRLEEKGVRVLLFVTLDFVQTASPPYEYVLANLIASGQVNGEGAEDAAGIYHRYTSDLKYRSASERQSCIERLRSDGSCESPPRMLSVDDVRQLARHPLVDLGAHSCSHVHLPSRPWLEQWREIRRSKSMLETITRQEIFYFAYPYGAHSRISRSLARLAGYRAAFATGDDRGEFARPRQDVRVWLEGNVA